MFELLMHIRKPDANQPENRQDYDDEDGHLRQMRGADFPGEDRGAEAGAAHDGIAGGAEEEGARGDEKGDAHAPEVAYQALRAGDAAADEHADVARGGE